jgi:hypothetical protein
MPCGAVVERQQLMEIRPRSRTSNARFPPIASIMAISTRRRLIATVWHNVDCEAAFPKPVAQFSMQTRLRLEDLGSIDHSHDIAQTEVAVPRDWMRQSCHNCFSRLFRQSTACNLALREIGQFFHVESRKLNHCAAVSQRNRYPCNVIRRHHPTNMGHVKFDPEIWAFPMLVGCRLQ